MRFIYKLYKNSGQLKNVNNFNLFEGEMDSKLRNYYHVFYILYDEINDKNIGCAYTYNYRYIDGHCKLSILIEKEFDSEFQTILERFIQDLNCYYPIRKVFVETCNEYDVEKYKMYGFDLEATLKNYVYLNGKYVNKYILGYKVLNDE